MTAKIVPDILRPSNVGGAMSTAYSTYTDILSRGDKRLETWFLMGSPIPTGIICLLFIYIVKVAGPRFMEKREPYQLKNFIIFYNFLQVLISVYIFYEIGVSGWFAGYSLRCEPVDYSDAPQTTRMLHASYWYFLSKFSEFFDTFFFVLRKKNEHVSLLHVVHHSIMPFSTWIGVKYTPGGHSTFFGFLNTFVHIWMYLYYMLAAMGPQYQKFIWWKKYLTKMQIVQFMAIMIHSFQLCFFECDYPRMFVWWIGCHAIMFLFLFGDFYRKAYNTSRNKKSSGASSAIKGLASVGRIIPCSLPAVDDVSSSAQTNGHANGHANNGYSNGHAGNGSVDSDGSGDSDGHATRLRRNARKD